MSIDFDPVGRAVDSGRLQAALGFNRQRLNALVSTSYDHGVGAALPRPVGILGGSMVWDAEELQEALPAILEARQRVVRNAPRIAREPVSQEALAAYREHHKGVPHVLGLMDAEMIAAHFNLGPAGARYPGEWASRGKLLPEPAGVIGTRRVWAVEDVKGREDLILKHLARRREISRH
ncbi:hypothetical protein [Pseudarthrobacter phenanthrenivorans]|uniref:Uncharacterized protein n=1 Tax=Pseudarthrobacter phenanthrenivorans TaxID=361575 RepID=A0A0B4EPW6_PSEPS|nr:hypothetical protein [Pseudarthrobacter phenanthrenivorans]KIC68733.1 hypothetical protein RM50_04585 [Pseudarthrobacter phenanthrenivorans]